MNDPRPETRPILEVTQPRTDAKRKVNPSKSRQGRAVLVNGALRNPHWTPPRHTAQGRNPGERKHPRMLSPEQIADLKSEARNALLAHKDYEDQLTQEMNDYFTEIGEVDWHLHGSTQHHLDTFRLKAARASRKLECLVSRELDQRWTVNTLEGDETFIVR